MIYHFLINFHKNLNNHLDKLTIVNGVFMVDFTLVALGSIFFFGGMVINFVAFAKGVNNAFIWALFPILHGIHEYIEFLLDSKLIPDFFERFELFFAITSSFVLLMACIEYLGVINSPNGKYVGLAGIFSFIYILFFSSDNTFNAIHNLTFDWGIVNTEFLRLFYGFIIPSICAIIIFLTYLKLRKENLKENISVDTNLTRICFLLILGLFIFAFFEGFDNNDIGVLFRGISAIMLLLIPAIIIIYTRIGLNNLLIFNHTTGRPIFVYNFVKDKKSSEEKWILTAGVLTAISSLSTSETDIGAINQIKSDQGQYILTKTGKYTVAIQTRTSNKVLEKNLLKFKEQVNSELTKLNDNSPVFDINNHPVFENLTEQLFKNLA